jgi:DNA polymerase I-like protein with 3'-5' exonuclease and polymerase domains
MVYGPGWTKADRYHVKRIVFGRLYGGGVSTLATQAGVSEAITASVVDSLDALTPTLAAWSGEVRNSVKAGRTRFATYSGRVIHMPTDLPHKAPNWCIQGTARELTVDAMLDWSQTRWGNCTLFAVHDELDAFVPAAEADDATAALVKCMTREINGVAIVAEASKPSSFWADSV